MIVAGVDKLQPGKCLPGVQVIAYLIGTKLCWGNHCVYEKQNFDDGLELINTDTPAWPRLLTVF